MFPSLWRFFFIILLIFFYAHSLSVHVLSNRFTVKQSGCYYHHIPSYHLHTTKSFDLFFIHWLQKNRRLLNHIFSLLHLLLLLFNAFCICSVAAPLSTTLCKYIFWQHHLSSFIAVVGTHYYRHRRTQPLVCCLFFDKMNTRVLLN